MSSEMFAAVSPAAASDARCARPCCFVAAFHASARSLLSALPSLPGGGSDRLPRQRPLAERELGKPRSLREVPSLLLSLSWRRVASCPSRHGRVRRCPASSHRLTAEPQRRRHVIYRCSALLRLGWRRHRATCAIGAAANASGQEPALLRTGCHRDLYHRTTTLPRTRSASACQGRMPRPLCGHYLRLQLRLDTARGRWLAIA